MNKIVMLLAMLLLVGCDDFDTQEQMSAASQPAPIDKQNACAELYSTLEIEISKRMEIAKSYGFTPIQGQLIEKGWAFGQQTMGELSLEFGKDCAPIDVDVSKPDYRPSMWCRDIGMWTKYVECKNNVAFDCISLLTKVERGMTNDGFTKMEESIARCTREKLRNDPLTAMTAQEREDRMLKMLNKEL